MIKKYLNEVQPPFDGMLGEIQRSAIDRKMPIIDCETAHFLNTVLSIKRPKKILEIGCAIGFSAALMSKHLKKDGHITTIDRYDIMIKEAKENFKKLEIENKITLLEGDAVDILKQLNDKFDVIFLDAAKGQYLQMLPDCLRLLNDDGIFIADDVLQGGRIAKERLEVPRRQRTIHTRMRMFLNEICTKKDINASIIPIADGVLLAHKTGVCI